MPRFREERPSGARTARLPRLHKDAAKPNINRKAQEIIAAHMYEDPSEASFVRTAPLLQQIDKTAPRTARSHDISHLQDKAEALCPVVPSSKMDKRDYVYEPSFLPKDASSVYNDEDGMWHTLVFPSDKPSTRMDAVHLDSWITKSLTKKIGQDGAEILRPVDELVNILSVALHEVSRQVTHHCVERGQALDRIWKTYVELFDRVMRQMRELLTVQKSKTGEAQAQLSRVKDETRALRKSHPQDMHRAISDLEERFSQEQKLLEERLKKAQEDGVRLKQEVKVQHRELEAWFPGFVMYQDSAIKNQFAMMGRVARGRQNAPSAHEVGEGMSPDVAIAEDFKRLLSAINPEKRKAMGQELASSIELAGQGPGSKLPGKADFDEGGSRPSKGSSGTTATNMTTGGRHAARQLKEQKAMQALQEEIDEQEEHIQKLRREISELEANAAGFGRRRVSLTPDPSTQSVDQVIAKNKDDDNESDFGEPGEQQPLSHANPVQRKSSLLALEMLAGGPSQLADFMLEAQGDN